MNYATERLLAAAAASLAAWENEERSVRQEHAATIEELEGAIHYFNAHGEAGPPAPQVLIHMDGGLVQDIIADRTIRAVVIDYDTDGADKTELYDIPQASGYAEDAFRSDWGLIKGTEEDAAFIVAALDAPPTYPKLKAVSLRAEAKMSHNSEATRAAFLAEADQLDQLASETEEAERAGEIEDRERYGRTAYKDGLRRECNPISVEPEFAEKRAAWFRGYDAEAQLAMEAASA